MATIGAFLANADGSYSGAIRTLSLNVKAVQFRPVEKTGERSPDFRVYSGQTAVDLASGETWLLSDPGKVRLLLGERRRRRRRPWPGSDA